MSWLVFYKLGYLDEVKAICKGCDFTDIYIGGSNFQRYFIFRGHG